MIDEKQISIFWFRRDLRYVDNKALFYALTENPPVLPLFIFDENILSELHSKVDPRIVFIYKQLEEIELKFRKTNSSILIKTGEPIEVFKELIANYKIKAVYANKDYESYAINRDLALADMLDSHGIKFRAYKDHVIFEEREIVKKDNTPYTIYTPYSKIWKKNLNSEHTKHYNAENHLNNLYEHTNEFLPLEKVGFKFTNYEFPSKELDKKKILTYDHQRDFPAVNGTTRLGVHLRFGTVSIRSLVKLALGTNEVFLNELIWREFFIMILANFPYVEHSAFKPQYDNILWLNNEDEFNLWCEGNTGYPMVDAGMRELNETGYMHNRLRMITASFLSKHLLVDWRWGEAYFANKLLDFELASNNGGWQWSAGTGCDASPYFRVFNPTIQAKRYDAENEYIRRWVPEYNTLAYTKPIIEHKFARERAIATYKAALDNSA